MITKQKKTEIVAELVEKLKKASGYYLVDFQGMTVEASIRCRREMKKKNVDFKVVKNTLLKRAIDQVGGIEFPDDLYCGSTAVVLGYDDPTVPAKVIKEQFDKFEKPKLKAAFFDGQYFDNTQLKQLASLPSKQDMMAAIVGSLNAPISGIVGSINAVMRDVAYLIEEVAKTKAA